MSRNRKAAQLRSLSQISKGTRSSGEKATSAFERNIDIASDKHTPFGIPAQIKQEIKLFKRQQIEDSLMRSREEFHNYINMADSSMYETSKKPKKNKFKLKPTHLDGDELTGVSVDD